MDDFIEKLLMIYNIVVSLAIMLYPFLYKKDEEIVTAEKREDSCVRWKSRYNKFMLIFVIVTSCVLFGFALKEKIVWILILFISFTILEKANEAYASFSVIRETISSKGCEALTKREADAIIMLAAALLMLNLYKVPQRMINVVNDIANPILADWVMIITVILMATLYFFLIGILSLIPIKAIISLIRRVKKLVNPEKLTVLEKKYRYLKRKMISWEFFSTRLIEWTLFQKNTIKTLWLLCLMIIIPVDIILKLICIVINIIMTIVAYTYYLIRRINKSLTLFSKWLDSISDIIFRAAFVFSISSVVLVNRYCRCLKVYENSTAGFEFVASAIVIPLIFSWIVDYKSAVKTIEDGEK